MLFVVSMCAPTDGAAWPETTVLGRAMPIQMLGFPTPAFWNEISTRPLLLPPEVAVMAGSTLALRRMGVVRARDGVGEGEGVLAVAAAPACAVALASSGGGEAEGDGDGDRAGVTLGGGGALAGGLLPAAAAAFFAAGEGGGGGRAQGRICVE